MYKRNFILVVIAGIVVIALIVAGSWIAFYRVRAATDAHQQTSSHR
ncbi:MAG TPA: hypothetical protein VFQ70_03260 [Candidatus Saccharimonadaceae bacterium]|nr:hypothetical protein [Candidatus Saccharimonadaceae bacterium]